MCPQRGRISYRDEMIFAFITWTKLEDVMLSGISQTQKDNYCQLPIVRGSWSGSIHRTESGTAVAWSGGAMKGESAFNRYRVSVLQDEEF